jgi:predicted metal-binding protein
MSACSHACAVAFASEGKYSYLFGDLPSDVDNMATTASAILSCAEIYCDRPDGMLAWKERPEPLKSGVIARIPPL